MRTSEKSMRQPLLYLLCTLIAICISCGLLPNATLRSPEEQLIERISLQHEDLPAGWPDYWDTDDISDPGAIASKHIWFNHGSPAKTKNRGNVAQIIFVYPAWFNTHEKHLNRRIAEGNEIQ